MAKLSPDKLTPRQKNQIRYKTTMPDNVKANQKQLNRVKSKARHALSSIEGFPKPINLGNALPVLETHGFTPNESGSKWVQIYDFLVSKGLINPEESTES